eukprot:gene33004-39921_t
MGPLSVLVNQVPYANRSRVKDDVKELMEVVKSLLPKIAIYVQNNGAQTKLLTLNGTIPIYYQGAQYNIPIEIFLPIAYPQECPKLFVRPTPSMCVKQGHKHVDTQGCVYLPYLHEWKNASNLKGLVETASGVFSIEPPLFSKPTTPTTNPTPSSGTYAAYPNSAIPTHNSTVYAANNNYVTPQNNNYVTPQNGGAAAAGAGGGANMYGHIVSVATPNPISTTSTNTSNVTGNDPLDKLNLIEEVSSQLQQRIHQVQVKLQHQLQVELEVQVALAESRRGVGVAVNELKAYVDRGKKVEAEVNGKTEKLRAERLRREGGGKAGPTSELGAGVVGGSEKVGGAGEVEMKVAEGEGSSKSLPNPASAPIPPPTPLAAPPLADSLTPYDPVSQQLLTLLSSNAGVEDTYYVLHRALSNGLIDLPAYLKEVRKLATQQFLGKLHVRKILGAMSAAHPNQQPMDVNANSAQAYPQNSYPAAANPYNPAGTFQASYPNPYPSNAYAPAPAQPPLHPTYSYPATTPAAAPYPPVYNAQYNVGVQGGGVAGGYAGGTRYIPPQGF